MDNKFILAPLSACVSESVTYPLDYIKTHIQINKGKLSLSDIIKRGNLYDGLKPALMRHCVYSLFRINMYEKINNENKLNISNKYLIGGLCGGVSQFIASPLDLLKVKYITKIKSNKNIKIHEMIRTIYKDKGLFGLWRGATPNIARAILVNFGELATYDIVKTHLKNKFNMSNGVPIYILSTISSGYVSTLCCNPADVIKSRMMKDKSIYNGVFDCIYTTYKKEGIITFYKGFFPMWCRQTSWQFTFWITYENLKEFMD